MQKIWDAVIIGSGAAGLSAAQALGRSLRRTLVIDSGSPRNRFASHMHNVLGLDGTPPHELVAKGRAEAAAYGVEFTEGAVSRVLSRDRSVIVQTESGDEFETRALIVATGISDVLPEISGLREQWGRGVLHCPYCHGWEVRGTRLGVIAASPLALHQAKMVRQLSDQVTLFTAGLSDLTAEDEQLLRARGVAIVADPVVEVIGDDDGLSVVRTQHGGEYAIDAVFSMGEMVPHDAFLSDLALERSESPVGSFLTVDQMNRTSHPRIWAAGNVTNPSASVPIVMGAGTFTGAAVNAALVEEDFADALAAQSTADSARTAAPASTHDAAPDEAPTPSPQSPTEFWDQRYSQSHSMWSGRVNASLERALEELGLAPGRSLDLGSGEGGDVLWLAERGWSATGIELSNVAVERARAHAAERSLPVDRASFIRDDLTTWVGRPAEVDGVLSGFDLVTASFLQSPVELPRERVLRAMADRVAPGGHLVVIAHGSRPSWAGEVDHIDRGAGAGHVPTGGHHAELPTPESELAALALDESKWEIVTAALWNRPVTAPDGSEAEIDDTVVIARRRVDTAQ